MQTGKVALAIGLLGLAACSDDVRMGTAVTAVQCIPGQAAACACGQGLPAGQVICGDGGFGMCQCGAGQPLSGGQAPQPAMPDPVQMPPSNHDPEPGPQAVPTQPPGPGPMAEPPAPRPAMTPADPMEPDPVEQDPVEQDPVEPGPGIEVPATDHCAPADNWDPEWSAFEQRVLELTNENRAAGAVCGGQPQEPAGPLTMNPQLRCSARLHAKDMADLMYFDHTSADGRTFDQRITQAGYTGWTIGENIAQGQTSPEEVVQGWMDSPGHCVNIMNGGFTEIGVGFYEGAGGGFRVRPLYWVQNFGAPRPGNGRWP